MLSNTKIKFPEEKIENIPLLDINSQNDKRDQISEQVIILDPSCNTAKDLLRAFDVLFALGTYCVSSILMTLVNKYVLSELQFKMNFLLLTIQSLVCVLLLMITKRLGLIDYKPFNWNDGISWLPISILLVAMIYTGSKSLQYLPISVFTIFKNLTIILIAYGDKKYFNGKITPLMIFSFLLMALSSICGGLSDLTFNLLGYIWMTVNCICTAAYVLFMRFSIRKVDFKDFDTVFFNNFISVPILIFCSLLSENWYVFMHSYVSFINEHDLRNALFIGIAVSSVSAFLISYSSAWCVRVASSTTYSMVGALNKLPVAVSGMIFIPTEKNISPLSVSSVIIAFISGILYSKAQIDLRSATAYPSKSPNDNKV